MHPPTFFASLALALFGATLLGVGLLNYLVGREWNILVAAGAILLIASRLVRRRAMKMPLIPPASKR